MDTTVAVSVLLIAIGIYVPMMPMVRYVVIGWVAKRKDIMDGLHADARLAYFEMFSRSDPLPQNESAAKADFEKLYERWYGRRFFVVPGLILFLVCLISVTAIVFTSFETLKYITPNPFFPLPKTAMAGFAGAYLWVVDDFISRARRLDFSPADVMWGVLRLVIAIPMGYAFASVADKAMGPFIAFALGAFPLTTLMTMLRRLAEKKLNIDATTEEASDDIVKLQGVNKAIVERLANEDVTTVTQMAYCDPVRLTMRSNLNFNFVTDCMNQALAWMYFPTSLDAMRSLSLRGAVEIKHLIDDLDDATTDPAANARAKAALPKIAAKIGQDEETLQLAFREISQDPFTQFLDRVWT